MPPYEEMHFLATEISSEYEGGTLCHSDCDCCSGTPFAVVIHRLPGKHLAVFGWSHLLNFHCPVVVSGRKDTIPARLIGFKIYHGSSLDAVDAVDIEYALRRPAKKSHYAHGNGIRPGR